MDGGGRIAEPLTESAPSRPGKLAAARRISLRWRVDRGRNGGRRPQLVGCRRRFERWLDGIAEAVARLNLPKHSGAVAAGLVIVGSAAYGTVRGGHVAEALDFVKDVRDVAANTVGFNISAVALSGQKQLSREEVLAAAGITGRVSLLFFDVADARARLLTNPWIAEATVRKLLPDRLQITITEREAFALWQKAGRVSVIAGDGTVLAPYVPQRYASLPLVVGDGAERQAKAFLAVLDRYPALRANVSAAVLIAQRRWNLRLRNGVDVRLPESEVERALDQLTALEREKGLSGRDVAAIDLRLADRITVRLSDAAAQARDEVAKKKSKPKGSA